MLEDSLNLLKLLRRDSVLADRMQSGGVATSLAQACCETMCRNYQQAHTNRDNRIRNRDTDKG